MIQQEVTLNGVVAWVAWALAIIAGLATLVFPGRGLVGVEVLFVAVAVALHVRGFIHKLERRELDAFNLGRESVGR